MVHNNVTQAPRDHNSIIARSNLVLQCAVYLYKIITRACVHLSLLASNIGLPFIATKGRPLKFVGITAAVLL
jgi:competence transcription factor ComK